MSLKLSLMICTLSITALCAPLSAELSHHTEEKIRSDVRSKKYDKLGFFLKNHHVHSHTDLKKLQKIARQEHSQSLSNAVKATNSFKKIRGGLGISSGVFLQTALFMETSLKHHVAHKNYYIQKRKTGLYRTLEYDPHNKKTFVILDGFKSAFLGQGAKKTAYKSIQYINTKSQVVARAQQESKMDRELKITKHLRHAPGIVELKGTGRHKKHGKKYTTIYSKLYTTGTVKTLFKKKIHLSLYEKVKIAFHMLQGLESMHKRCIVHRDLSAKNFFITIPHGKPGRRNIKAVLADFGWSQYIKNMFHKKAQANMKNTAPEGIFFNKMKGSQYFATDVYAVGLVLYRLIYKQRPSWQDISISSSRVSHYKHLCAAINKKTHSRRNSLAHKKIHSTLTNKERFEYIIHRMIHIRPWVRPSASKLCRELQSLLKRLK